ncbi:hypothetical protein P8605_24460 [Streptomyces sp. T-3]|nr:hypothetical protein [Streptomyces sp. T-3]
MELTEYETRYVAMLDELKGSPEVRLLVERRGPVVTAYGDTQAILAKLARRFGLVLDESLQSHLLRFRQLACQWETGPHLPALVGEFSLKHFYTSVTTGPLEISQDFPAVAERTLASELRLLDDHPESGAGSFVAMQLRPDASLPKVWYFTVAHGFEALDVGFNEYLDTLLVTKGVYGWQYLFADVSLREDEFIHTRERLAKMLQVLPEIFPQHDYTDLRTRLEARL